MDSKIWLSPPHMSGHEQEFIDSAFKTNYIAPAGDNILGFEQDLETYLGEGSQVTLTNSGTSAIHLALLLLGIGKGDEVICQTKTFVASVNPIKYLGAVPVFVDSEADTWNMSPDLLKVAIEDRLSKGIKPKAIIVVHLYGMPYKVNEIHALGKAYEIPIIEDSAEALGSYYLGRKCGAFGAHSILSFNGNKIITTSAGGALISKSKELKAQAYYLANQAKETGFDYLHKEVGFNYVMSNITAGIGRGQMKVLEERINSRRRNFKYYHERLKNIDSISFQEELEGFSSNRWLTCLLFDSKTTRDQIALLLESNGIESRFSWRPMHRQPIYEKALTFVDGTAEDLSNRGLCVPSGSNLNEKQLNRITSIITSYFG